MRLLPLWYKGQIAAYAKVDDEDHHRFSHFKWYLSRGKWTNYARLGRWVREKLGCSALLHRLVVGETDKTVPVCHMNHDGTDNQRKNLSRGTFHENSLDRSGPNKNNSHNSLGISHRNGRPRCWRAQIQIHGRKHEKSFHTKEEALAYRKELEEKYGKGIYAATPLNPEG